MLNLKTKPLFIAVLACGGFLAGIMMYGCQSNENPPDAQSASPTTQPVTFALFGPPPHKTGVQLWADNCMRCHNGRPPEEFSNGQWETIVHHMRLRANLTGEEAREITAFLQASR
jgi:hypothetical protein